MLKNRPHGSGQTPLQNVPEGLQTNYYLEVTGTFGSLSYLWSSGHVLVLWLFPGPLDFLWSKTCSGPRGTKDLSFIWLHLYLLLLLLLYPRLDGPAPTAESSFCQQR